VENTVTYKIWRTDDFGHQYQAPVSGFQIGRFAIRQRSEKDVDAITRSGKLVRLREHIVDHINTGIVLVTLDSFEDAVVVADDVSRFSRKDPSTKDREKFFEQLGEHLINWLKWCIQHNKAVPFRNYQEQTQGAVP
jgi:hypothetical protein